MAGDFDYGSFWEEAVDALDALNALCEAVLRLPRPRDRYFTPGTAPAFCVGKSLIPADYAEQRQKAFDAIGVANKDLAALLAEDRFVEPLAGVWPPCAPRELTTRFSHALVAANRHHPSAHQIF